MSDALPSVGHNQPPLSSLSTAERAFLPIETTEQQIVAKKYDDLVGAIQGHYDGQAPVDSSTSSARAWADGNGVVIPPDLIENPVSFNRGKEQVYAGTTQFSRFRDGTQREVSSYTDGTVRTTLRLPEAIRDRNGAQMTLVVERKGDGETYQLGSEYDLYRWSKGGAVGKVPREKGGWGNAEPVGFEPIEVLATNQVSGEGKIYDNPDFLAMNWRQYAEAQYTPGKVRRWLGDLAMRVTTRMEKFANKYMSME